VPTYDYQCRSCDRVIEVIHPMTAAGPSTCEACGGELRRVLYPAGIIFKGSGFYRTDSRASTSGGGSGTTSTTAPAASTNGKESSGSGTASDSAGGSSTPKAGPAAKETSSAD
jgi:putative FmdB family regulatory protein